LEVLCDWWEKMKAEGVYDNTKIIIVADHGFDIETKSFTSIFPVLDDARAYAFYNPLLLVKDFNATGEVKTSYEFMTNADVPTIAVSHLPEDLQKNPFTGKVLNSEEKHDGITIISSHKHSVSEHGKYKFNYTDNEIVHVKNNIFVKENWSGSKPIPEHY
jgi:arylsulfatase A-like enzyme